MKCTEHITDKERLGYNDWHDRTAKAYRAGQRQKRCSECQQWIFPFEIRASSSRDETIPQPVPKPGR